MYQSNILPEYLIKAYLNTNYSFTDGSRTVVIRLDNDNLDFLSYLKSKQIKRWAYITAWNPKSIGMPHEFNAQQQKLMLVKLKKFQVFKGEGKISDNDWQGEESYFVVDISREEAVEIGKYFEQNAILVGRANTQPELLILIP